MKKTPKVLLIAFLFVFAIGATFYLTARQFSLASGQEKSLIRQKTDEVLAYVDRFFVDDYDEQKMADAAAAAMVSAGTDPWSFYLPADEVGEYEQTMSNSYVGIGVTIEADPEERGLLVSLVAKGNAADKAGIRVGDIITEVEGEKTFALGVAGTRDLVVGEPGTDVSLVILRDDKTIPMTVTREVVETEVASLVMLNPRVAYIKIENFDERAAQETLD
jgi:carboxyl-terminal processing protease